MIKFMLHVVANYANREEENTPNNSCQVVIFCLLVVDVDVDTTSTQVNIVEKMNCSYTTSQFPV